jgi:CubicO group peptidase (beta-lactamase class C family)
MHDAYRGASFKHLLCHRSGLPANFGMNVWQFSRETADARQERKSYVRTSLAMPPVGPMTATFEYSSHGYVVAGAMLEAKLVSSWEDLVRTHLFQPLGLLTAGFGAPGRKGATGQPLRHAVTASGKARLAYPVGPVSDYPVVLGPAGRVHMSLQDLLRYLAAHRDRSDDLKPQTWTILHTPPFGTIRGHYAMGRVVRNGTFWHSGTNALWYSEAQVDPGRDTVAAACNDGRRP